MPRGGRGFIFALHYVSRKNIQILSYLIERKKLKKIKKKRKKKKKRKEKKLKKIWLLR